MQLTAADRLQTGSFETARILSTRNEGAICVHLSINVVVGRNIRSLHGNALRKNFPRLFSSTSIASKHQCIPFR
jgi:hypothetical protein